MRTPAMTINLNNGSVVALEVTITTMASFGPYRIVDVTFLGTIQKDTTHCSFSSLFASRDVSTYRKCFCFTHFLPSTIRHHPTCTYSPCRSWKACVELFQKSCPMPETFLIGPTANSFSDWFVLHFSYLGRRRSRGCSHGHSLQRTQF
jgi:hypothetical protein